MIKEITITIPGLPVPRNSQKVTVQRGKVRQYVPERVLDYKHLVAWYGREAMDKAYMLEFKGCLEAELLFVFPAPMGSLKKAEREKIERGELLLYPKISKDVDNLCKNVLDSLQHVVYGNDKQIVDARLSKRIGKDPQTVITIRTIS